MVLWGSNAAIENTSAYLNASLFGFGDSSHVPQGDLVRETVDEFIAKPKGSGKNILIDPNNWNSQTEIQRDGPPPGFPPPPGGPQKEQLKVRINQDLILNENLDKIRDPSSLFLEFLFPLFLHIDFPHYYNNSKCTLNNINKMFPHLDGPNAYSKKDLKIGETFNVLGYEVNWGLPSGLHSTQSLTLYITSETSELYLLISCIGHDNVNLWEYRDLEKLLDGVVSLEEKRNSIIDNSFDKSEGHPPFLFSSLSSTTTTTESRLWDAWDVEKGLSPKKVEVHAKLQFDQDSLVEIFHEDGSDSTIEAKYFFENEKCSLLVKESKSMEENHNKNKYNEFYIHAIRLRQGKGFSFDPYRKGLSFDPYNDTLTVYAKTKDSMAILSIECTSKYWTLSTSQNEIETLLNGAVSFVDVELETP